MSWLSKIVHGSIDFALGQAIPKFLRRGTEAAIKVGVFGGRERFIDGSRWLTQRLRQGKKRSAQEIEEDEPLWKRAIHVPEEGEWIELKDSGRIRDVEYVIQEHKAKKAGRHFDIRLVLQGTSVSWALPMKGKREKVSRLPWPGERWAAIRQPDHAIEYNRFEGKIPDGELGAGTVKIWASGKLDVHKIEKGAVHFEIFSGPAKGKYVLVPTQNAMGLLVAKKPEGVDGWTKHPYSKRDYEVLEALEGQGDHVAERKVDGAAVEIRVGEQGLRTFSHRVSKRTGTLIEHSDRLAHLDGARVEGLADTRLRAEAWHRRGVNFLSGTLNSTVDRAREVQRTAGPIQLDVFDITHYKGKDVSGLPYAERRALYEEVVAELDVPQIHAVRAQKSNFPHFYDQQVALQGAPTDGIVLKETGNSYAEAPWVKVKPSDTVDCSVVGVSEGLGRHAGRLGALTVRTPEGKLVQVGTGFTDWERSWIWDHREDMDQEVARVAFHVRGGETSRTGPRFDSWHPDKSEAALKMYAEAMNVSPYALKSAAGWRPS